MRENLLVFCIHEGAAAALGPEIGVADGRTVRLGIESVRQHRVRPEPGRAAIELPRVAEEDPGAAMHRLHDAANLYVHVAVFSELADGVAILPEAHDGEAAFLVWRFGRAHIEEARAVRKL